MDSGSDPGRPRRSRGRRGRAPSPTKLPRTGPAGAASGTHVRQSVLYSDRPRRSRGRRGRALSPTKLLFEEHAGKESSSELGPTFTDLSKFEVLAPNDTPTLESTDGAVVHAGDIGSSAQDSTISEPSVVEETLSLRVVGHAGAMGNGALDSTLAEPSALEEALTPLEATQDGIAYLYSVSRSAQAEAEAAEDEVLPQQSSLDEYEARSMPAPEQVRSLPARARHSEASMEEIIQNGKKWMSEEVMVAFAKYIEEKDDLKGLEYQFDELRNQCFHVENYYKIFHHFNFTVKMKTPGSTDWTSVLYFAEVKEIFRQKIYFCSPLQPNENGHCHACTKQGMGDLKHPVMGAFDRGNAETVFPFMYESDSDDFLPVRLSDSDDEPW